MERERVVVWREDQNAEVERARVWGGEPLTITCQWRGIGSCRPRASCTLAIVLAAYSPQTMWSQDMEQRGGWDEKRDKSPWVRLFQMEVCWALDDHGNVLSRGVDGTVMNMMVRDKPRCKCKP